MPPKAKATSRSRTLGLSEHTVKNYLFRIFEKLGVSNRFELLFLLFKECNGSTADRRGAAILN